MCALNGKLYIVGGSDPYGQKGLKNCDVFDPVTKSWTSCAPLNIRKLIFCFSLSFSLKTSTVCTVHTYCLGRYSNDFGLA